jgi:hypothetical protein
VFTNIVYQKYNIFTNYSWYKDAPISVKNINKKDAPIIKYKISV